MWAAPYSGIEHGGWGVVTAQLIDGKYQVLRVLGKGGGGTVYVCTDPGLHKEVAVKVINPNHQNELTRFQREAKALSLCDHPSIIRIRAFGVDGGKPYYVMDYIQGRSLAAELEANGPLTPPRFAAIFRQLLEGLQHAHNAGIIHRDIKPSNIMLSQSGDVEQAILIDFGLTRSTAAEGKITSTAELLGTPLYMSPEQATGAAVDQRSDIYSAGCTMFQAATGRTPFTGEAYELLIAHLHESPMGVPKEIKRLIDGSLAKNPHDRFQNVGQMLECLEDSSLEKAGKFTVAEDRRPPSPARVKRTKGFSTSVSMVSAVVAVLLLGIGLMWKIQQGNVAEELPIDPKQEARLGHDLFRKVQRLFERSQNSDAIAAANEAIPHLQKGINAAEDNNGPHLLISVLYWRNLSAERVKLPVETRIEYLKQTLKTAEEHRQWLFYRDACGQLGELYLAAGKEQEAKSCFDQLFAHANLSDNQIADVVAEDSPFGYHKLLSWLRSQPGTEDKRTSVAKKLCNIYRAQREKGSPNVPSLIAGYSEAELEGIGKDPQFCRSHASFLDEQAKIVSEPWEKVACLQLGAVLRARSGDRPGAIRAFRDAIAYGGVHEAPPKIHTATAIHTYASIIALPPEEELELQLTAYRYLKDCSPEARTSLCTAAHHVGVVYDRLGDYKQARAYFEEMIDVGKEGGRHFRQLRNWSIASSMYMFAINGCNSLVDLGIKHHDQQAVSEAVTQAGELKADLAQTPQLIYHPGLHQALKQWNIVDAQMAPQRRRS